MRLSRQIGLVSVLALAVMCADGIAAPGAKAPMFRAPLVRGNTYTPPKYVYEAPKRMEAFETYFRHHRSQDVEMLRTLREQGTSRFEMDATKVKDFTDRFERHTKEIEAAIRSKDYEAATRAMKAREEAYAEFITGQAKEKKVSYRASKPASKAEIEEIFGTVTFGAVAATGPKAEVGRTYEAAEVKDNKDHDSSASFYEVSYRPTPETTAKIGQVRDLWQGDKPVGASERLALRRKGLPSSCAGGVCASLAEAFGTGPLGAKVAAKADKAIQYWLENGQPHLAERFANKLKEVMDVINKMPGEKGTMMKEILAEILRSKGINGESFTELENLANGDVASLQGLHEMAIQIRQLREAYGETVDGQVVGEKAPEETSGPAYEAWLAKRDSWVASRIQEWVELGGTFRSKLRKSNGEHAAEFAKWVTGKHEYVKEVNKAEKDLWEQLRNGGCANSFLAA